MNKENTAFGEKIQAAIVNVDSLIRKKKRELLRKVWIKIPYYGEGDTGLNVAVTRAIIETYAIGDGVSSEVWPHSYQYPTNIEYPGLKLWLVCENGIADEITSKPQLTQEEYDKRIEDSGNVEPLKKR